MVGVATVGTTNGRHPLFGNVQPAGIYATKCDWVAGTAVLAKNGAVGFDEVSLGEDAPSRS